MQTPYQVHIGSKIWHIVEKHYPVGTFTSTGIREKFMRPSKQNLPIKLLVYGNQERRNNTLW